VKLEKNLSTPIGTHTNAGSTFDNRVTLTFDLLISRSVHAERLLCTVSLPSLVLIARAVFFLERGHSDRQTDAQSNRRHSLVSYIQRG